VEISPILLQKGETQVALYGMGSLRDERLNRMWQSKKVRFQRPGEGEWFNMFALHQNRDLGRGSKNCVHESMIPEWMDLIVWGHEHECLIDPTESVVGTFRITQPGSSVATSLTAGEAIRKHVGFLDIRGSQFRMTKVPLVQVRTFLLGELSLNGQGLDPEEPKIDEQVSSFLETEVKVLIREAKEKRQELLIEAKTEGNDPEEQQGLQYKLEKPDQHLVRLKVEHSGFTTLNNQRFGARFVGRLANPVDILLFHRKKETGDRAGVKRRKASKALDTPIAPEEQDEMKVEDLIKDNLDIADKKLEIFDETKLTLALEDFVSKEVKQAMTDATMSMLSKQQKKLLSQHVTHEPGDDKEDDEMQDKAQDAEDRAVEAEEEEQQNPRSRRGAPKKATPAPKRATTKRKAVEEHDEDDDFTAPKSRGATSRPPKRQTKSRSKYVEEDDDDDDGNDVVEILDDDEEEEEQPKKRSSRGTSSRSARSSRSKKSDGEKFGDSFGVDDDWSEANTMSER
jgi:double-strand break repair protein MRE11